MKGIICFIAFFFALTVCAQEEIKFKIDTESSVVKWTGSKLTGTHEGTVKLKPGELITENGAIFGKFEIDMTTVACTDITDPDSNRDLVGHLTGADFFDVANHPTASLEIQGCEIRQGPDGMPLGYTVLGALTIKGVTNAVEFPMDMRPAEGGVECTAAFKINRTKWGITYKSKSILGDVKDKFIYDDIEFEVVVKGIL